MQTSTYQQANISKREQEVLHLIVYEYSTKEIAKRLHVCYETAHSHRKSLLKKMGARNTAGLVRLAFERGLF
jgi:DNA-binding NarL/FixJ family response regulator